MNTIAITPTHPSVLVLAGLDPTGGAGLAADIGALASMGAHVLPIATCLTVQDTHNVSKVMPVDAELLQQQLDVLLRDIPIAAIKIGLLCAQETIQLVNTFIQSHPDIPVILDPIMRAGGGKALLDDAMIAACRELLPHVDILTPNHAEAHLLAGIDSGTDSATDSIDAAIKSLLQSGAKHILLTGTDVADASSETIVHQYYNRSGSTENYSWPRLPGTYHGSGCTLAAATAGLVASGLDAKRAIEEAQQYTWDTLANAIRLTDGQAIPNRFYWSHDA